MIDEFALAIEPDAPQWDWNPTDEDLHRLFWSKPLPMDNWSEALTSDAAAALVQKAIYGTTVLRPDLQVTITPTVEERWIVRLQSGECWYDVEGGKSATREGAEMHCAYLKAIQPHVRFQVFRL